MAPSSAATTLAGAVADALTLHGSAAGQAAATRSPARVPSNPAIRWMVLIC
jgi:hypothetical protein